MKNPNKLATAPNLDILGAIIARFYGGEEKQLKKIDEKSWAVTSIETGKILDGVRVVKIRGGYMFEMV